MWFFNLNKTRKKRKRNLNTIKYSHIENFLYIYILYIYIYIGNIGRYATPSFSFKNTWQSSMVIVTVKEKLK